MDRRAQTLREIGASPSALLCDNYRHFLEVVAEEADHLGVGIVPFIMPCGLGYLEASRYEVVLSGSTIAKRGQDPVFELGAVHAQWMSHLAIHRVFAYPRAALFPRPRRFSPPPFANSTRPPIVSKLSHSDSGILSATLSNLSV